MNYVLVASSDPKQKKKLGAPNVRREQIMSGPGLVHTKQLFLCFLFYFPPHSHLLFVFSSAKKSTCVDLPGRWSHMAQRRDARVIELSSVYRYDDIWVLRSALPWRAAAGLSEECGRVTEVGKIKTGSGFYFHVIPASGSSGVSMYRNVREKGQSGERRVGLLLACR